MSSWWPFCYRTLKKIPLLDFYNLIISALHHIIITLKPSMVLTSSVCWMLCTRCEQEGPEAFLQQTPDRLHRGPSSSPGRAQRSAASGLRAALCSSSALAFLLNCLWKRGEEKVRVLFADVIKSAPTCLASLLTSKSIFLLCFLQNRFSKPAESKYPPTMLQTFI